MSPGCDQFCVCFWWVWHELYYWGGWYIPFPPPPPGHGHLSSPSVTRYTSPPWQSRTYPMKCSKTCHQSPPPRCTVTRMLWKQPYARYRWRGLVIQSRIATTNLPGYYVRQGHHRVAGQHEEPVDLALHDVESPLRHESGPADLLHRVGWTVRDPTDPSPSAPRTEPPCLPATEGTVMLGIVHTKRLRLWWRHH